MFNIMNNPFKAISILYRKSHIWLNNSCMKYNLTAAQAIIILMVCDFKELTQDDITKKLGYEKSVIAKTVTKLEKEGYLTRSVNIKDKRTYNITPTKKAYEAYPFMKDQIDICFKRMTKNMTKTQQEEFKKLLLLAAETTISQDK